MTEAAPAQTSKVVEPPKPERGQTDGAHESDGHDATVSRWIDPQRGLGPATPQTGSITRRYLLALQRRLGNQVVSSVLQATRGPVAFSATRSSVIQRSGAVDDALTKHTPDAVDSLSKDDIAKATVNQRMEMVTIVLGGGGGTSLPRLWDSFGSGLEAVATAHPTEWQRSMTEHAEAMRNSHEVNTLQNAGFYGDIENVAWAYLRENEQVVKTEMQRLGIPEQEGGKAAPNAAQEEELRKAQAAAGELARAQQTREQLRQTEIAYHKKAVETGQKELPQGGVDDIEHRYDPMFFDPDNKFDAMDQPTDYLPGLRTWDDTYKQHVELTNTIKAFFIAHPSLYALSRADDSGSQAGGVNKMTPAAARSTLGDQLHAVQQNIVKSRDLVPTVALKMTPIQEQLLSGQVGASVALKRDWSTPFLHSIGKDMVAQQQPGPWWQTLGVMSLEAAAFVVAGLATGGIGPALLAAGQAALSLGKYQALEAASRSNVTPDTVLIQDGEVVAAAVETIITTAVAFLAAVGAARALFATRIASAAGRALAEELGEDVARRLLIELSPDAAQALKTKLGTEVLKDLALRLGGGSIEKLAQELAATEIKALLNDLGWEAIARLSKGMGGKEIQGLARDLGAATAKSLAETLETSQIKALIAKAGSAVKLKPLLDRAKDPARLMRFFDHVSDPEMLGRLMDSVDDLDKLDRVLDALGSPQKGSFALNIGGEMDVKAGDIVINPGRQAFPVETIRKLNPDNLVIEASAEKIPLPDGAAHSVYGRKLPNSIDWTQAAEQFDRVLKPGGTLDISTYGPAKPLVEALKKRGFTIQSVPYGYQVKATKP